MCNRRGDRRLGHAGGKKNPDKPAKLVERVGSVGATMRVNIEVDWLDSYTASCRPKPAACLERRQGGNPLVVVPPGSRDCPQMLYGPPTFIPGHRCPAMIKIVGAFRLARSAQSTVAFAGILIFELGHTPSAREMSDRVAFSASLTLTPPKPIKPPSSAASATCSLI